MSISKPRSIYVVSLYDLFFIFILIFSVINHITNVIKADALVFCTLFRMSSLIFG